jgi:hypothetical protein
MDDLKQLVRMFNKLCTTEEEGGSCRMDLEQLHRDASKRVAEQTAFLVDTAKAEALDNLGEPQAAIAPIERHV